MSRLEKIRQNSKSQMVHERTKETKEPRRHTRFVYTLIFLLLSGVVYLLIFSGYFDVNQIEISGYKDTKLIEEMTARGIGTGFLEKNILFINTTDLEKTIKEGSGVRVVEVARRLPDKIDIRVEESVGVLVWNTVGESFFIDERGYVIEKNNNKDLPQVFDNANIPVTLGERVASPTLIKFIIDASNNFEPIVGQKIAKIIIYDILTDVHIKSVSGWTVYLDATKDPKSQLENLVKVLAEAKKEGHTKLEYIDMRLDNKVYYK